MNDRLQDLMVAIQEKNQANVMTILNEIDPTELNKEILAEAIKSENIQIITSVAGKTDTAHFDKEILSMALNTKNARIAPTIIKKTDIKYFDKEILALTINSKESQSIALVTEKTESKYFDKEILTMAINSNNARIAPSIIKKTDKKYFDKEILGLTIDSKQGQNVNLVSEKTDSKYFDKDTLEKAINTNIEGIIRSIAQRTDVKLFDKNIIKLALKTKIPKIIYAVGKYTDEKYFDREILDLALATKNAELVRPIVDYTKDKELFLEYKLGIQKALFTAKDLKNLTAQILSRSDNESFDREMQELVIDTYLDVIQQHFAKGDVPKNFPMKQFEDSINQSRYFFSCPEKVNFDTLNEKNRFLVLPVFSYGHAFTAVVRKLDDGNISITFVNLGARPFEKSGSGNQYKEFVYKKEDALKVLNDHSYSIRIHYPDKAVRTEQAYKNFKASSIAEYNINVSSRDQKVGNCFLKNVEKGIRYALALGLSKTSDQEFTPESLRVTSINADKYKVKFLKPIFKPGDKTNELTTVELKEELVKSLIKKFPEYTKEINQEWDIYKVRKEKTAEREKAAVEKAEREKAEKERAEKEKTEKENKDTVIERRIATKVNTRDTKAIISDRDKIFIEKMNSFANKNSLYERKQNIFNFSK